MRTDNQISFFLQRSTTFMEDKDGQVNQIRKG